MRIIPVESLKEGMVVARDIVKASGHCLVSKGTILTLSMIESLPHHGITIIPVQSEEDIPVSFSEKEISEAEEACMEKVLSRFTEMPSDPMMKILFKTALRIEALEYLKCANKQ